MKKRIFKNSFKAMLLVLSMLALMACLASSVIAQTGDSTRKLTITFDSETVKEVTITYNDADGKRHFNEPMVSGEPVTILNATNVEVTILPKEGYKPVSVTDASTQENVLQEIIGGGYRCYWANLTTDVSAAVACETRTFKVYALDYDQTGALSYTPIGMDVLQLSNGSIQYTYKSTNRTELPAVKLDGYHFDGWRISLSGMDFATYTSAEMENGRYYIPAGTISEAISNDFASRIYVYPVLTALPQYVVREDIIYTESGDHRGDSLTPREHPVQWQYPTTNPEDEKDNITALELMADDLGGLYKTYAGYTLLLAENCKGYVYPSVDITPAADPDRTNVLTRFFIANRYALIYEGVGETYNGKTVYVYGNRTEIANPTRIGHTFVGWTIKLTVGGEEKTIEAAPDFVFASLAAYFDENYNRIDPNDTFAADADADGQGSITLVAKWTPNEYTISYDWNLDDPDADLAEQMNALNDKLLSEFNSFVYASDPMGNESYVKLIPAPVRPGHDFVGWSLRYTDALGRVDTLPVDALASLLDENGSFSLDTDEYPSDVLLIAQWKPESYTIKLKVNADDETPWATLTDVVYGQTFVLPDGIGSVIPEKRGYKFLGFYTSPGGQGTKYINADGTAADVRWLTDDDESGAIALYAHWEPNSYDTIIHIGGIAGDVAGSSVTVTITPDGGEAFTVLAGESFRIVYGTSFTVTVTTANGYKVVITDGEALSYTTEYSKKHECTWVETNTITVNVLPVRALNASDVVVQYLTETFDGLAPGRYYVVADGVQTVFQIVANQTTKQSIDPAWFGKTIHLVYCGDGVSTSDSDPVSITLAARPAKPSINSGANSTGEIKPIQPFDSTITITMMEGIDVSLYEFAVVEYGSGTSPVWQSSPNFEGVKPGTIYDIYVRVKATDTAPHGEEFVISLRTTHIKYIDDQEAIVEGYRPQAGGALANALLDDLLAQLDQLGKTNPVPDDFYAQVEALMAGVEDALALANKKDAALERLAAILAECKRAGDFGENEQQLNGYYTAAIDAITAADSAERVEACFDSAVAAMKQVPVMKIWDADALITLESILGLDQTTVLQLIRDEAFEDLARAVRDAIRTSGKVQVGSFMTLAEAEKLLRALDVVAYYNFNMMKSDAVQVGDTFLIRLTLPEDLVGKTGLQVAYYNEQTGDVELLRTWMDEDGRTLIFEAKTVRNFVILADPTVNLMGVILTLGGVLLLQLIALAVLLYIRSENKKNVLHASLALPAMFLTVHFAPANGEIIAMLLAAAVIVMQIVLIVLLLKSDMIYRFGRRREEDAYVPDAPVEETEESVGSVEEAAAPVVTDPVEEEATLTAEASVLTDTLDEAGETAIQDDPFGFCEEIAEDEDFIEPAATTRYSLPDDEMIVFEADDEIHEEVVSYEESYDEEIVDEDLFDDTLSVDESYPDAELDSDELFSDDEEELYEDGAYAEEYPAEEYAEDEDASYGELPYIGELGEEATEEELEDVNALYGDEGTFLEEETYDEEDAADEDADTFYGYDE